MATHPGTGNQTWLDYPNITTPYTANTSENIENAIDALFQNRYGTSVGTSPPAVGAYLSTGYTNLAANTDYLMGNNMTVRGSDPWGMWSKATWSNAGATPYTVTIPSGMGGRYDIEWFVMSSAQTGTSAIKVVRNCPSTVASQTTAVGSYSLLSSTGAPSGEGTPARIRSSRLLSSGDTLTFALWSSVVFNMNATTFGQITTELSVRYLGPN